MPDPRVTATLDALVDEAYRISLDRGVAITNPDGWKNWKRAVYADTARREGPGYLRHHHQRLGLALPHQPPPICPTCSGNIITATHRDDDPNTTYCSYDCAGIQTMTLTEYIATLPPDKRDTMTRLRRRQEGAA